MARSSSLNKEQILTLILARAIHDSLPSLNWFSGLLFSGILGCNPQIPFGNRIYRFNVNSWLFYW